MKLQVVRSALILGVLGLFLNLIFVNCEFADPGKSSLSSEMLSEGGDLTRGIPWTPPSADDADTVVIDDMILDRSQISEKSQQLYFPSFYSKTLAEKKSGSGTLQGVAKNNNGASFWPDGLIPIKFHSSVSAQHRNFFLDICSDFGEFSNVRCTTDSSVLDSRKSHVLVRADSNLRCGNGYATVGYRGENKYRGVHNLVFGVDSGGCSQKAMHYIQTHELIHILGFYHAHVHLNRDDHVIFYPQNVRSGKERNFRVHYNSLSPYDTAYDSKSIMHYWGGGFAKSDSAGRILSTLRPKNSVCRSISALKPYYSLPSRCRIRTNWSISKKDKESIVLAYGAKDSTVSPPRDCDVDNQTLSHNSSIDFYKFNEHENCESNKVAKICEDGVLHGPAGYKYSECDEVPVSTPSRVVRTDIATYSRHARPKLVRAKSWSTNRVPLYFKSDESKSNYNTYFYGAGAAIADKELSWALNRIYYAYCEAKKPNGNKNAYFNRCIKGLRVYSQLNSSREVALEFKNKNGSKFAEASSPQQAASTLISYLEQQYGDADFNSAEEDLLLSPAPATIFSTASRKPATADPTPAPKNSSCQLDGVVANHGQKVPFYAAKESGNCNWVKLTRTCNNGVFSGHKAYKYKSCKDSYYLRNRHGK